jgi:hypothetical protein
MPVIQATNETYRQIIARPGLTLAMQVRLERALSGKSTSRLYRVIIA